MPRAFESIPPGAPVLVIDSESTDATVPLALARGADVIVRPWPGFVAARRGALAAVRTSWTFMLDADEALDPSLVAALHAKEPRAGTGGYAVPRTTYFCGRPIRGGAWGIERPLRLFRTREATVEAHPVGGGTAELHEAWHVRGRTETIAGTLHHHSYPDLATYRAKYGRYTALEALGLQPSYVRFAASVVRAVVRAPWLFAVRGGWRDGWRGAYIAVFSASYPVVVAWKALRR